MESTADREAALITVLGTPVYAKPAILANMLGLWGLLTWLSGRRPPVRPWPIRLAVAALSTMALLAADLGHAMAHIVSARMAGAPMDRIELSSGMPRTLYLEDDVPPDIHRQRALGGPIFNACGLAASLTLHGLTPRDSVTHEVSGWSSLGHGLLLVGSLAPLPMVDGGSILKWTLVKRGNSLEDADGVVRQADLALGASLAATGIALAARRRWLPAVGLIAVGGIAVAAGLGKLR
jgi:hypothetical protein